MSVRRGLACLITSAGLAIASVTSASAGIWTPIPSGTTGDITAVSQPDASTLVYGTAAGQILKNGALKASAAGSEINDIAFNPSKTVGLAAANNGKLLISTNGGETWAVKTLNNTTFPQSPSCFAGGPYTRTAAPAGNFDAVSWASDSVGYAIPSDLGEVLKTTDGGTTWTDVSRQADGSCRIDTDGDPLTDVKALPGTDLVWFLADDFGTLYVSSNGLASSTTQTTDSAVNCFDNHPQLALDFDNPNRAFAVDRCPGTLQFGFTQDGGSHWELSQSYFAGNGDGLSGLNDVDIAGGSAVAVGNAGAILIDNDGRNAYFQRADGANATNDWLSVDKLDATHAAVGGRGGALLTTTQATATAVVGDPQTPTPRDTVPVAPTPPPSVTPTPPPGRSVPRAVARFRARFGVRARHERGNPLGLLSVIRGFSGVPDGGHVEVRCVRGCSWRASFTMRRTGTHKQTSLTLTTPRPLTTRTLIDVRVSSNGLLGRFIRYKFQRTAGIVLPYRITSGCLTEDAPLRRATCP